jgi:hypothetical protein
MLFSKLLLERFFFFFNGPVITIKAINTCKFIALVREQIYLIKRKEKRLLLRIKEQSQSRKARMK